MTNPIEYGPLTETVAHFERYSIPKAEEAVIRFQETGEAVSVWQLHLDGSTLSNHEIKQQINSILNMCDVPEDFHPSIRVLKRCWDTFYPDETTFENSRPSAKQICDWLSNINSLQDDPNDLSVGFAIETENSLVVCKHRSEECAIFCDECSDQMDTEGQSATNARYSCSHMDGEYGYIFDWQISLYPKEGFENICWSQSWPWLQP